MRVSSLRWRVMPSVSADRPNALRYVPTEVRETPNKEDNRIAYFLADSQTHSDDRGDVVQGLAPVDILFAVDVVPREVLFENVAR